MPHSYNVKLSLFSIILGLILPSSVYCKIEAKSVPIKSGIIDRFYVGADNSCDYSNIEAAITASSGSPNQVSVLIAYNKTYKENLVINHNNIQLDGTYESCEQARRDIPGRNTAHVLSNISTGPIVHVRGQNITLKNLTIRDHAEGGVLATRNSIISLENVSFTLLGSTGFSAVKIMTAAQVELIIKDSDFSFNTSEQGGAINCENSDSSIDIQNTVFSDNQVSDNGGAVYADGCDLVISASSFQNNSAEYGGALYIKSSNSEILTTSFITNHATKSSGALLGVDSTIDAEAVNFIDNQSDILAGAIGLSNSTLNLKKTTENCSNHIKCNYFNNNQASFGAGAIGAEFGIINISGAYFENNRADYGTVLYLTDSNITEVEGSVFVGNGDGSDTEFLDQNVISLRDDAVARITYSTFADNKILAATFNLEDNSELSVYSSIIYDPTSGDIFSRPATAELFVNCLITHENHSFANNNSDFITVTDPIFISPENGDYHINVTTSPAVDYCADTLAMAEHTDIDNEARGFDHPNVTNNPDTNGTYDIGADETYVIDVIFIDGFE